MEIRRIAVCIAALLLMTSAGCDKPSFFETLIHDTNQWTDGSDAKKGEGAEGVTGWNYKKYEKPPEFQQETLELIARLEPAPEEELYGVYNEFDSVEEFSIETSDNPYQVPCPDPDYYWNTAIEMLNRYFNGAEASYGNPDGLSSQERLEYVEVLDCRRIAGDRAAFAAETVVNIHVGDTSHSVYERYGTRGGDGVIRCGLTVYGVQQTETTYELKGIVQTEEARKVVATTVPFIRPIQPQEVQGTYRIQEDTLSVTFDQGATWTAVPVTMKNLFVNEDVDGGAEPSNLEEGSYYISPEKSVFVYGGEEGAPVRMLISADMGQTWEEKLVSSRIGVRRSFISVTQGFLYVVTCGDKTMGTEYQEVLASKDDGDTWEMRETPSQNGTFLATDMGFVEDTVGFLMVTSHETPDFYRTGDGGASWQQMTVELPVPYASSVFSMACAPRKEGDVLALYVYQEGYAPFSGMMCRYVSSDAGQNWTFDSYGISR